MGNKLQNLYALARLFLGRKTLYFKSKEADHAVKFTRQLLLQNLLIDIDFFSDSSNKDATIFSGI